MKIMAPLFTHEWSDEFDVLLFAWFYRIGQQHGFAYSYQMYADDCRTIAQKFFRAPGIIYGEVKDTAKWIHFAQVASHASVFRWKREPIARPYEVKSERAQMIWNYLLELEGAESLVYNAPIKLKSLKSTGNRLDRWERQKFKYYGSKMKDYEDDEH